MEIESSLVEADRAARRNALDVSRSFIVQAPAGSGKTELLIQRFLCLLSIIEQPEEILAITFTRKAALEMQARILKALQEARAGIAPGSAHQRVTLQAAQRALARDEQQGWHLVESPQRLRIQTIDALNAAIARSVPLSSGLGAMAGVVSDDAARTIYRAAAAATLDWLVAGGDNADAVEQLLVHLDNNSALYLGHIARMLETRDQWLAMTGPGQDAQFNEIAVRRRLEIMIGDLIVGHLRQLRSLLPDAFTPTLLRLARYAAASLEREHGPGHVLEALTGRRELPGASLSELEAWHALAELLLTRDGEWRRSVNRTIGLPPGDEGEKAEMLDMLERLAGYAELAEALHQVRQLPAPRYPDAQWRILLALLRVLPIAVAELRRLFTERRVTDYVEVALAARAALGDRENPGDVALLLDYSVRHLLIDEMQDTSIAQYELIRKLVAGWQPQDGRTLFCVGDPMQSIYRFRNAEVGEFLFARQQGVGDVSLESLVMRSNFRSGEHLVQWFNGVFADVFPAEDDIAAGAIAYAESVPVESRLGQGEVRVHPVFGAEPEEEAAEALEVIRECLAAEGDGSVAVLVRSRSLLPPLVRKLRAAGIDYHAIDIDRLTDLPEIIDLLALTRALCHLDDRVAWLGLLRGPWIGLTWADLHALVVNDRRSTVWELLHDPMRVSSLSDVGAARVAALVEELSPHLDGRGTRSLQEAVERIWYRLGGPCLLEDAGQVENAARFFDVLARLESAGTLVDVARLEERLDQEHVATHGSANVRVQIMTMHKAKGLQFEHVILYGLGRRAITGGKSLLGWLEVPDRRGGRDFLISALGARTEAEGDRLHALIESRLRARDRLEQDRLLYVACTRARRSLHLVGHVELAADGESIREPQAGTLLRRVWPSLRSAFETAPGRVAPSSGVGSRASAVFVEPPLRRLPALRPVPVLPPVPGARGGSDPGEHGPASVVDYDWAGSTARHAGSVVHRCLQRLSEGRLAMEALANPTLVSLTVRWAGELGIPASGIAAIAARAKEALELILRDERGRWLVFGAGHAELPITGIREGRVESVVIDRVRIDDDGTHWLVDYKTGTHEGGDLDRFLAQELERYRPQLGRYAALYRNFVNAPVRAALYFPLLQRFVEVPLL